jgi:hypothetical protein
MGVQAYGAQRELLLLSETDHDGVPRNNPMPRAWLLWAIRGDVDESRFVAALRLVAAANDVWHCRFSPTPDGPLLVRDPAPRPLPVTVADVGHAPVDERVARAGEALAEAVYAPMDLRHDPLARACLVRLGPHDHALTVVVDHGFADGHTLTGFVRRVAATYRDPQRPRSSVPSFLAHAATAVSDARRPASQAFWAAATATPVPAVSFPGGQWKPWWECDATGARSIQLDPPDLAALRAGMARTGATAPGAFLAAMSFLAGIWATAPVPVLYARAGRSSRESLAVPGPLHEAVVSVAPTGVPRSLADWVRAHATTNAAAPPLLGQWLTDFGGVPTLRERRRLVLNVQSPLRTFNLGTARIGPAGKALHASIRPPNGHPGFPARNALHLAVHLSPQAASVTIYHDRGVLPDPGPVATALTAFVRLLAEQPDIHPERAADLLRAGWHRDHTSTATAGAQA